MVIIKIHHHTSSHKKCFVTFIRDDLRNQRKTENKIRTPYNSYDSIETTYKKIKSLIASRNAQVICLQRRGKGQALYRRLAFMLINKEPFKLQVNRSYFEKWNMKAVEEYEEDEFRNNI